MIQRVSLTCMNQEGDPPHPVQGYNKPRVNSITSNTGGKISPPTASKEKSDDEEAANPTNTGSPNIEPNMKRKNIKPEKGVPPKPL